MTFKKLISALTTSAAMLSSCAPTPAPAQDRWGDAHAKLHFIGEAGVAGLVSTTTGRVSDGLIAGGTVAILREEWKRKRGFDHYSQSRVVLDALGTVAGAYSGAYLHGLLITPTFVAYSTEF